MTLPVSQSLPGGLQTLDQPDSSFLNPIVRIPLATSQSNAELAQSKSGITSFFGRLKSRKDVRPDPRFVTSRRPREPQSAKRSRVTSNIPAWAEPPLAQAYSQAVIHARLEASTVSSDAILQSWIRGRSFKLLRSSSAQWTTKLYILTKAGFLFEYPGEGAIDRTPDRVLQLTPHTAAFVSDAILGKPFVLQVSEVVDGEVVLGSTDSKSLFSKFGFRETEPRKEASSILLVFENVEHMNVWMSVLRHQIEILGGERATQSNQWAPDPELEDMRPWTSSGHAQSFSRACSSTLASPISQETLVAPPSRQEFASRYSLNGDADDIRRRVSRFSSDLHSTPSMTNSTVISHDQWQLDQLREDSRSSFMSSGRRTILTSRDSTSSSSPVIDNFPIDIRDPSWSSELNASIMSVSVPDLPRSESAPEVLPSAARPTSTVGDLPSPLEWAGRARKGRLTPGGNAIVNGKVYSFHDQFANPLKAADFPAPPSPYSSDEFSVPAPYPLRNRRPASLTLAPQKSQPPPQSKSNSLPPRPRIQNRRSMPAIAMGPPPLPPPDCPLPPPPVLLDGGSWNGATEPPALAGESRRPVTRHSYQ